MADVTVTTEIPSQPALEPTSEASESLEQIEDLSEEVRTVADEILEEVKECRTNLNQATEALTSLQSEGGPAKTQQVAEALVEVKNLREEMRSLLSELKESMATRSPIPSTSPSPSLEPTTSETIDPANAEPERPEPTKKKKRYKI